MFKPKYIVNAFPKAGTHRISCMLVAVLDSVQPDEIWGKGWTGTFDGRSWTDRWMATERTTFHLSRLQQGQFIRGHIGYKSELDNFFHLFGASHLFIYRDFRDVAVSQTYHIMSDKETLPHPGKEAYKLLGGFDEILSAVITGFGEFPGVMDRWEYYAPWLKARTLPISFEESILEPKEVARKIIEYGYEEIAMKMGGSVVANEAMWDPILNSMVESADDTSQSVTFRKGKIGGWKKEFASEHVDLFKESDKNMWITRLGYKW